MEGNNRRSKRYSYYTIVNGKVYWLYDSSYDPDGKWLLKDAKEDFDIPHYSQVPGIRLIIVERDTDILAATWNEDLHKWEVRNDYSY